MSLRSRVIISFLALLMIGCGTMLVFVTFRPPENTRYAEKIVLRSEAEYVEFKEIVGNPDVDIESMMVLSSEPPIVIDFVVYAPTELYFPYADKPEHKYLPLVSLLGVTVIVVGIYLVVSCARNTLDWGRPLP